MELRKVMIYRSSISTTSIMVRSLQCHSPPQPCQASTRNRPPMPTFARMNAIDTEPLPVRITNRSRHPLPAYATVHSAGMDLRAHLDRPVVLEPGQRTLIPTGLYLELPEGTEAQVRPRSGLAFKHGITVLNSPGTIDADYRGECKVILINHGTEPFVITRGERIAQLVIAQHARVAWDERDTLETTERGAGGFGSTGRG